jgi:hypothetical protein
MDVLYILEGTCVGCSLVLRQEPAKQCLASAAYIVYMCVHNHAYAHTHTGASMAQACIHAYIHAHAYTHRSNCFDFGQLSGKKNRNAGEHDWPWEVEDEKDSRWLDEDIPTPLDALFGDDAERKNRGGGGGKGWGGFFGWR